MRLSRYSHLLSSAVVNLAVVVMASAAYAGTSGPAMPWDGPLTTIRDSLSGTIAHILITVAIIVAGFVFALGDHGTAGKRLGGIALGGAIALGAVSFMTSVGWAGALI